MIPAPQHTTDWIKPGVKFALYSAVAGSRIHYVAPNGAYAVPGGIKAITACGKTLVRPFYEGDAEAFDTLTLNTLTGSRRLTTKTDCLDCLQAYCTRMRPFKNVTQ